jgi:3-phosphoshikimate 1-carboxyvinyltransferase
VINIERPRRPLQPLTLTVPGDISSAVFLLAAGLLVPGSHVSVPGVGVNPRRTGLLDVLRQMGADVSVHRRREEVGEPVADITVQHSSLRGVEVSGDTTVRAIDELPLLAVVATQAEGRTEVRDAAELRVKETDRIATIVTELRRLGANIEERRDGFMVEGPSRLGGAPVTSHGDHRLGMALAIAGLVASGPTLVEDAACIADSYPGFAEGLQSLGAGISVGG